MKKHILFAAGAMLAAVLMTGCGSKPAETTAAATAAETESTAAETTQAAGSEAESSEAEVSADNPFAGKTVKVGCSATFVPFESIEMAADGSKTYVGMNIDIVKAIVEKNGGSVEFVDMPFKSLMAAIQPARLISAAAAWHRPRSVRRPWISPKSSSIREMRSFTAQRMITRIWIPFRQDRSICVVRTNISR